MLYRDARRNLLASISAKVSKAFSGADDVSMPAGRAFSKRLLIKVALLFFNLLGIMCCGDAGNWRDICVREECLFCEVRCWVQWSVKSRSDGGHRYSTIDGGFFSISKCAGRAFALSMSPIDLAVWSWLAQSISCKISVMFSRVDAFWLMPRLVGIDRY